MNFLKILLFLATFQFIKSEVNTEKVTAATTREVVAKNKIIPKKEDSQTAAVVTGAAAAAAAAAAAPAVIAKPSVSEIRVYDDAVLKWNVTDLNKRQSLQELLLLQLSEDMSFIKKSLIKIVNQNGDWTVIQRRQDGSVDFFRTWKEYKEGFGDSQGEFFIGLDNLHEITAEAPQELLIILGDFENNWRYAKYGKFQVGSEDDKYAIEELGDYSGDAGDSMSYHRSRKFSTKDQDNDNNPTANCAQDYKAGWWFDNCYSCNLNAPYYKGARSCRGGINWYHWHNYLYSLKFVEMMIRPVAESEE